MRLTGMHLRKKSCNVFFDATRFVMNLSDVTGVPPFNSRGNGFSDRGT